MTMRETTTGNGGLDRMRGGGRDGRGNLRENREDPAPTVGIAIRIAPKGRPLPPPSRAYHATPHAHEPVVLQRCGA